MREPNPALIAYTLFCDDVRHEQGNKYSAMGVYGNMLLIDGESQVLPKFVAMTVLEIPWRLGGVTGHISLVDDERVLVEGDFDIPHNIPMPGATAQLMASMPIEASPFEAKNGMQLQVRFQAGDFDYRSAILKVVSRSAVAFIENGQADVSQPSGCDNKH
jgi:hypothetical protein